MDDLAESGPQMLDFPEKNPPFLNLDREPLAA